MQRRTTGFAAQRLSAHFTQRLYPIIPPSVRDRADVPAVVLMLLTRLQYPHTSSVSGAEISSFEDLVVALDYGQFYLHTSEEDPELAVDLLGSDQGIAQQGGLVVVESPHQNNFEMPLRIEVWTARPDDDLDEWEEAFEVHLDVGDDGLMYESPTLDSIALPVPSDSYHAIITGRGFVGQGWPGSTTPGDSWRIRLWPSDGPPIPARLREFADADDADSADSAIHDATPSSSAHGADRVGCDDSLADQRNSHAAEAGQRIGADLNLAPSPRVLSHQVGAAVVDVIILREIDRVWPLIANLDITLSSAPNDAVIGNEFTMGTYDDEEDGFVGIDGAIVCRWTELVEPTRVAMTWTWTGYEPQTRLSLEERHARRRAGLPMPARVPRVEQPTTLTVSLSDQTATDTDQHVRVHIDHADLPVEWIADMTAIWLSKIDQWVHQSAPKRKTRRRINPTA